ncbi:MAG: hypothetical protein HBSAPP03_20880 [Phycisphaerae bacterium]|nr:MAG: hypothetical protein HBSAPP03_20880 [Phycisphaerae bacterium]
MTASDFASPNPPATTHARTVPPAHDGVLDVNTPEGRSPGRPVDITGPVAASGGITDVQAVPGTPSQSIDDPAPISSAVLIDAKVGDVNGRPILVRTFFETGTPTQEALGPRLAAEARTRDRAAWLTYAREQINRRLDEYIRDELLRAEALSSLTPQERQGLFAVVERIQADMRREAGGTREQLKRQLETERGLTVDQWARKTEQMILVRRELERKINRGINVSWRDIEQAYYGRFRTTYQHPPRYRLYLVIIPNTQTADRAAFEQGLASGRAFDELAGSTLNRHQNNRGGLEVREVPGDLAATTFFPNPALDAAAKALGEGQTSDPVDLGDSTAWVHLAGIDPTPTLYGAQLDIEGRLRTERSNAAIDRYLLRLQGKANVSSVPQMRARLLQIAAERYGPN